MDASLAGSTADGSNSPGDGDKHILNTKALSRNPPKDCGSASSLGRGFQWSQDMARILQRRVGGVHHYLRRSSYRFRDPVFAQIG